MESSPAFPTFSEAIKEAIDKFYALIENDETLFNEERMKKFLEVVNFRFEDSDEEVLQSLLNKTFHEKFIKEKFLPKIFNYWEKFLNASTQKQTSSKVSLNVGTEAPEVQKNSVSLEVVSDTKKQTELLNTHLSSINPDVEVPFAAVKFYSATPNETRDFLDGLLQQFTPLLVNPDWPFTPELSVSADTDHVVVQLHAKKSIELTFVMYIFGHLIAKLPEYDVELRLNIQSGTNFRHLILNHTDNTIFDLLNGFKIWVEFKNNFAGFLDEIVPLLLEGESSNDGIKARVISFLLGSVSLNSELNLNLGANELALLANLPPVNIFDKEGILSAAPLDQAKALREDEMGQMILPNLNNLEGKADVFVSCPFFTAHLNLDGSGALELANSTIDLFSN